MTPRQIALVRESFGRLAPEPTADMFYKRLFILAPNLKQLFQNDMRKQGKLLMEMLGTAIDGLDDLETTLPLLEGLGARHAEYGVKPQHYQIVGAALIWTLADGLDGEFTSEVEEAWSDTYRLVSTTMSRAAEQKAS